MTIQRWTPAQAHSPQEKFLMARVCRHRKLFGFLRDYRHLLFDDAFQSELEKMYRRPDAGKQPVPPAQLCMALILQGYVGVSDAEAVELSVVDLRWQMVLGCLGADTPAFSQGSLVNIRTRLIEHDMDRRLLERTREIATETGAFDPKKLPRDLRMAVDSSPLEGAGKVEDTFNLLAHAGRNLAHLAASALGLTYEDVCRQGHAPVLLASSPKAGLDINWSDANQNEEAMLMLMDQLVRLDVWVSDKRASSLCEPALEKAQDTLHKLAAQDLEPANEDGSGVKVRKGVAPERQVSIEDEEMRHGRKSKSKRFDGYKRHIATDLDTGLIAACAVTPANRPEQEATPDLRRDLENHGEDVEELHIDRGYIGSRMVEEVLARRGTVFCKPWSFRNNGLFDKSDFKIDLRSRVITCPSGQSQKFSLGSTVQFDPEICLTCPLRSQCTTSASGRGRSVHIAHDEALQKKLRDRINTKGGRAALRERVQVEHRLAHLSRKQKKRARFVGVRKNLFDTRRAAAVLNLETIHRAQTGAANAA